VAPERAREGTSGSRPPGLMVERYAVFDEFAAGGMATVHFARLIGAHGFRRTVAVKRLLPHLTRNHDFALMLIDEARLAARVCHPNVVATLDVVQTSSELLLVMEYIHGESLAKLLRWTRERGERIPVAIACAIMADALHGLHAAHEATDERGVALGLVHRDVSPQNVLIGLDGITRIADFGVAKAAGRAQTTRDGVVKGKLAYMAPEQLSGGEVTRASDVFAAAVVLWEALSGKRLFVGQNHAETVFKVLSAPIPLPSTSDGSISPALAAVVMRGLAREPARRFASARELALALEENAPSVRPSELSAWVEHVVGDRLAARNEVLRAIERHEDRVDTQANTLLRQPRGLEGVLAAAAPTQELAGPRADAQTGTRRRETISSVEPAPVTPTPSAQPGMAPRPVARGMRRRLAWTLLFLGLSFVAGLSWRRALRTRAFTPPPAMPAAPVVRARAELPAPVRTTPIMEPVMAPPTTRVDAVPPAPSDKPRVRPARGKKPAAAPACDPPYAIDAAGRRIFKVECM
jgi:serine/threonine protein kinase